MSNYISIKSQYTLDDTIEIKGEFTNGLPKWHYDIILSSVNTTETKQIATGITADKIKEGIKVSLGADFAPFASPYGKGAMCSVKVYGYRSNLLGKEETTQATAYFHLYGNLIPDFDLSIETQNKTAEGFGEAAVKGFSEVTAKISNIKLNYGAEIAAVSLSGGVFALAETKAQEEYSVTLDPIEVSGEIYINARIVTKAGYQTDKSVTLHVFDYKTPLLDFGKDNCVEPKRIDENGKDISNNADKNKLYALKFAGIIKPCTMLYNNEQICRVKDNITAKITEIGSYTVANNTWKTAKIPLEITLNDDGTAAFAYNGTPTFSGGTTKEGEENGLYTYKAYKLEVFCKDTSEKNITLTYRIRTLGTAFHLGAGGNKAKFGGYAEEDDTLGSAWRIHCEKNIEADEGLIGDYLEVSSGIKVPNKNGDKTHYKGTGTEAGTIAEGDHIHGNITNAGFLEIGGKIMKNVVVITNADGQITCIDKLTDEFLIMGTDADIKSPSSRDATASVGTAGKGLCYADHVHPYSELWKEDADFRKLNDEIILLHDSVLNLV